ncbi:MAG: hypothetical protein IPI49_05425 [Myxococcales bacterium]|nr:hypothetical protein [Myxococcales bacterium]HRC57975.1 hypothetical protein [Kofleriaceae bacterium]
MRGPLLPVAILLGAFLLTLDSKLASADVEERKARALQLTAQAMAAEDDGRFAEALSLYALAFEQVPHPEMLYKLGEGHRIMGELAKAMQFYEQYLAITPNGSRAADARRWLTSIETVLARKLEEQARQDEARRAAGQQAAQEQTERERAAHLRAEAAMQQEARRAAAELMSTTAPRTTGQPPVSRREMAVLLGGLSVLSLGAGVAFELSSRSMDERYQDGGATEPSLRDSADHRHTLAWTFALSGAVGGAVTTYLWLTGARQRTAPGGGTRLAPQVTTHGASALVLGRF